MTLHIYNTLTRQKEEFKPINPKNVRIYFCGPTVYNYAHIGNARAAVAFGLLAEVVRYAYGRQHVQYASNFTDIDDKIMDAAKKEGVPISDITEKFGRIYNEDMAMLGVSKPDHQPRATEYVVEMVRMMEALIKAGHAYEAEGHVLFNVPSWPEYGRLSRRDMDEMIAGARVDVAPYKKHPADFVLWKPSTPDQPGWDSPFGRGRPGWHIECSAMTEKLFGHCFDIHAGGEDLIFPHHENEIAQSTCAHGGEKFVNYWMHNGWLMVEGVKMSKSLGNVLLVHDLVNKMPGEVIRVALLSAHYRQPFDWTEELAQQSRSMLDRYYGLLREVTDVKAVDVDVPQVFAEALLDDLNTPKAFAELAQIAKSLSTANLLAEKEQAKGALLAAGKLLGLLQQEPEQWFKAGVSDTDAAAIEKIIAEMQAARQVKDYTKADQLRDTLKHEHSVVVSVTASGITWKKES